jgi:putative transposase
MMGNYSDYARRSCSLMLLSPGMYYYRSQGREDKPLRGRIREIAISLVRYGYWRIYILLRRGGWHDNHKRV